MLRKTQRWHWLQRKSCLDGRVGPEAQCCPESRWAFRMVCCFQQQVPEGALPVNVHMRQRQYIHTHTVYLVYVYLRCKWHSNSNNTVTLCFSWNNSTITLGMRVGCCARAWPGQVEGCAPETDWEQDWLEAHQFADWSQLLLCQNHPRWGWTRFQYHWVHV